MQKDHTLRSELQQISMFFQRSFMTSEPACSSSEPRHFPFDQVAGYALSDRIELFWLEDGDHDLKPRKRVSGETQEAHLRRMAERAATWIRGLE